MGDDESYWFTSYKRVKEGYKFYFPYIVISLSTLEKQVGFGAVYGEGLPLMTVLQRYIGNKKIDT